MTVQELILALAKKPLDAEVCLQVIHDEVTPVTGVAPTPSQQLPSGKPWPVVLTHSL